jgi:ankyrin repeat protein
MADERVEIPQAYLCPLSKQIMFDPVTAEDGHTYERELIAEVIQSTGKSPMTRQVLSGAVYENYAITGMIDEFLERNPKYKEDVYLPVSNKVFLVKAIQENDIKTLKELLRKDKRFYLQPLENGKNFFHLVCEVSTLKMFNETIEFLEQQKMLEKVSEVTKPLNWKPVRLNEKLIVCVKNGDNNYVQKLIKMGADINVKTSTQKSLLHVAAESNHLDMLRLLLTEGLAHISDEGQARPLLHIAIENNDYLLVDLLLQRKTSMEVKNANGLTALHKAVLSNDLKSVNYLLECGANPNSMDPEGNTPLHAAVQNKGNQDLLKALIGKGAYYKERNKGGLRPLDLTTQQEARFFMERHHKAVKKLTVEKLKQRVDILEQKLKQYEEENALNLNKAQEAPTSSSSSTKVLHNVNKRI